MFIGIWIELHYPPYLLIINISPFRSLSDELLSKTLEKNRGIISKDFTNRDSTI